MKNKKVAIIIVNWNGVKFLKDCLTAVYNQTYKNFDVYFVDNGSIDDSVDFVTKNFPKVQIIKLEKNTGFAHANNIGINKAFKDREIEYIFTLNNDTKIDKDCLLNLVSAIETKKELGSVAPKIKFFYESNLIDSVGILISADGGGINKGYKEEDSGQYDARTDVFGVCAGAALYKRIALEDVAYKGEFFDNSFFAYYEDLDLNWRLRLRKWKTVTCPNAIVLHIHSATGISYSPFKAYHVNRNRYFVILKNLPIYYLIVALVSAPYRYLKLINSVFIKKSGPSYKLKENSNVFKLFLIVLKGWGSFLINIPQLLIKRRLIQRNKKVTISEIKKWFIEYRTNQDDMIYK